MSFAVKIILIQNRSLTPLKIVEQKLLVKERIAKIKGLHVFRDISLDRPLGKKFDGPIFLDFLFFLWHINDLKTVKKRDFLSAAVHDDDNNNYDNKIMMAKRTKTMTTMKNNFHGKDKHEKYKKNILMVINLDRFSCLPYF